MENKKDEAIKQEWKDLEVKTNKGILIGYIDTVDKTDYIYDIDKNLIATIYNNDYKVARVLEKLEKGLCL